ncbi:CGNR zinc finger domain-containing protein [Amycolatopsis arida]|uniref:CGNR zinc finger domain-containing protein n=1 Tax=Amycolatopsis arida TaxID=587909 RepID=A0A1I5ZF22_9PSEU|nr:CGNR zinc finger domain-containing protein [Amycolatopsis arida]TDX89604.1 CGNR zinc finger protein [Amycolatopsis arida]SFQ55003.1 CGNR zinc finger domain-containing protein [Amycolatopsis arida]
MHFNPYGGAAAQVAADLVTLGPAPAAELLGVMRAHGMSLSRLTAAEAEEVVAWAGRLRAVFEETDTDRRVAAVNGLLADSACRPHISRHDGKPPHLHYADERDGAVTRVRAYTAGGLAHLVCDAPDRMGRCARPGCPAVFVDSSRNGRRRFCSTRCATRVHVAEHRGRRRVPAG